jgi:glucuronoarabinoxylan endo-1,4-beta-xylanase
LDATTTVPGYFAYSPASGAVLESGSQTLKVTFTPNDTIHYTTASASVTLVVNPPATKTVPQIGWAPPATVITGSSLSAALTASASEPGAITYAIVAPAASAGPVTASTVLANGIYSVEATFDPTDSTDYAQVTLTNQITVAPVAGTVVVDAGDPMQIIRGFGGSEAWSGPMPAAQINALYGTASNQIGLDIMRLRIAPANYTPATKTADTSQWDGELTNGAAVQALGGIVFATPWTAPASMKTNNSTNEGSLSTASYGDFANYLQAYINYAATKNVNLYAISVQNEPDWNPCVVNGVDGGPTGSGCYESELWTGAQMDTWVANNAKGLTTKLMMPESYYFANTMSDPTLNDPNAEGNVSIVGGHLYGSQPYYYTLAKSLNKDTWVTEHTVSLATTGATTQSIIDALDMAEELHNSMVVAQYNAYVYWWMVNSGTTYTGLIDSSGNMTYFGAAMAQFAHFVRPGYSRCNATSSISSTSLLSGTYISAYTGNGHLVIVAINANVGSVSIPVTVMNQTVTSLTPYQTTSSASFAAQSAITVTGNSFNYTLPPQSITTFVQ